MSTPVAHFATLIVWREDTSETRASRALVPVYAITISIPAPAAPEGDRG